MENLLRRFAQANQRLSRLVHRRLGKTYTTDGNTDFGSTVPWEHLVESGKVYDIGGGKHPFFSATAKTEHDISVVGVDVSEDELGRAEPGLYDETRVTDIQSLVGDSDGDLIVCRALLEHVRDVERAVAAIRTCVKPGGVVCLFVPCTNALFARLNRILPEGFKRRLLYTIRPEARQGQGFPAYYDRCTPKELERLFVAQGFELVEERMYFLSSYLFSFFPAYLVWQGWVLLASKLAPRTLCETVTQVWRLPAAAPSAAPGVEARPSRRRSVTQAA